MKKMIIKAIAIGLFAVLLALNITTTINTATNANVGVSLSGLVVLAQSGGEDGGSGGSVSVNCTTGHCSTDGCSISGYSNQSCVAGGCYDNCICSGYDENGIRVSFSEQCTPIAR